MHQLSGLRKGSEQFEKVHHVLSYLEACMCFDFGDFVWRQKGGEIRGSGRNVMCECTPVSLCEQWLEGGNSSLVILRREKEGNKAHI